MSVAKFVAWGASCALAGAGAVEAMRYRDPMNQHTDPEAPHLPVYLDALPVMGTSTSYAQTLTVPILR